MKERMVEEFLWSTCLRAPQSITGEAKSKVTCNNPHTHRKLFDPWRFSSAIEEEGPLAVPSSSREYSALDPGSSRSTLLAGEDFEPEWQRILRCIDFNDT